MEDRHVSAHAGVVLRLAAYLVIGKQEVVGLDAVVERGAYAVHGGGGAEVDGHGRRHVGGGAAPGSDPSGYLGVVVEIHGVLGRPGPAVLRRAGMRRAGSIGGQEGGGGGSVLVGGEAMRVVRVKDLLVLR